MILHEYKVGVGGEKSVERLGCNDVGNKYVMGRGMMGNRVLGFGEFSAVVSFCIRGANV